MAPPPTPGPGVGSRRVNPGEKLKLWHTLLKGLGDATELLGELEKQAVDSRWLLLSGEE